MVAAGTPVAQHGYWRNVAPAFQIVEPNMNKDQVKGVGEQIKGKVNEAVGKATDNPARSSRATSSKAPARCKRPMATLRKTPRTTQSATGRNLARDVA